MRSVNKAFIIELVPEEVLIATHYRIQISCVAVGYVVGSWVLGARLLEVLLLLLVVVGFWLCCWLSLVVVCCVRAVAGCFTLRVLSILLSLRIGFQRKRLLSSTFEAGDLIR